MDYVVSRDGTKIAYTTSGSGPPLVLVHGTASLHTTWNSLVPLLRDEATVHAVDRRGRGASGDGPAYAVTREFEDIVAVVEAITEASGVEPDLVGHSYGGLCAFGAATLTTKIRHLVLYEGWPTIGALPAAWSDVGEKLDSLLASGDREAVLETFLREVAGIAAEQLIGLRALPGWWDARVAAVHTIPREFRVEAAVTFDPGQAALVTAPTLIMVGEDSPDPLKAGYEALAAALGDSRVVLLAGQQHTAHITAPDLFARHLLGFLREQE